MVVKAIQLPSGKMKNAWEQKSILLSAYLDTEKEMEMSVH